LATRKLITCHINKHHQIPLAAQSSPLEHYFYSLVVAFYAQQNKISRRREVEKREKRKRKEREKRIRSIIIVIVMKECN